MTVKKQDELRQLTAETIAFRMVKNTDDYRRRHFFVLDDRKPVPFVRHWNYKNVSGVTFASDEGEAARAWVTQALLVGFTVFYSGIKRGGGAGRNIDHGIYSEDAAWYCQELKKRGLSR